MVRGRVRRLEQCAIVAAARLGSRAMKHDARALLGQADGGDFADAGGGARDDDCLACMECLPLDELRVSFAVASS